MQINLQFSEREYLRGKASEIRFSEQKTKFSPQKIHHSCVPSVASEQSSRHREPLTVNHEPFTVRSAMPLCYAKNRK